LGLGIAGPPLETRPYTVAGSAIHIGRQAR